MTVLGTGRSSHRSTVPRVAQTRVVMGDRWAMAVIILKNVLEFRSPLFLESVGTPLELDCWIIAMF